MQLSAADYYKQLSPKDVTELLGISKSTLWVYVKDGLIPEPHYPRPKYPKWKLGEVIEVYEAHLSGQENVGEVGGLARAQTPNKTTSEKTKPESTAQKLKKRFGLS